MSEGDVAVQNLVKKWKEKQERLIDPSETNDRGEDLNQRFWCIPNKCETTMRGCMKRRGNGPIYINIGWNGSKHAAQQVPRAQFAHCVKCNVWKLLPPIQKVQKHALQQHVQPGDPSDPDTQTKLRKHNDEVFLRYIAVRSLAHG